LATAIGPQPETFTVVIAKLAIIFKMHKPLDYQYCLTSIGY